MLVSILITLPKSPSSSLVSPKITRKHPLQGSGSLVPVTLLILTPSTKAWPQEQVSRMKLFLFSKSRTSSLQVITAHPADPAIFHVLLISPPYLFFILTLMDLLILLCAPHIHQMNKIHWQLWSDWPYAIQFVSAGVLTSLLSKLLKSPTEWLKYPPLSEAKETIPHPFTKLNLLFKLKKKQFIIIMLLKCLRKYTENAWHIWYFYVAYFFSLSTSVRRIITLWHTAKRKSPVHNMIQSGR